MISAILRSPKPSGQRELNIALPVELCNTFVTVSLRSVELEAQVSKAPPNYEDPEAEADQPRDAPDRAAQAMRVIIPPTTTEIALLKDSSLVSVISMTDCSTRSS